VVNAAILLLIGWQPSSDGVRLAEAAIRQLAWKTRYDASYARLTYPMGDVPRDQGACTDVVIRAYRALSLDLQQAIHEDARRHPRAYPRIKKLDPNIDHRRCPNQRAYFARWGTELPLTSADWRPGDIVFWKLANGLDHVGIVTAPPGGQSQPWVVHNIAGIAHEPVLNHWKIVGHFRLSVKRARS
jgi:uncharacterized protein